jgi:hypothetical protein
MFVAQGLDGRFNTTARFFSHAETVAADSARDRAFRDASLLSYVNDGGASFHPSLLCLMGTFPFYYNKSLLSIIDIDI